MSKRSSKPDDALLGDAVAALLRRVPERWETYEGDALTAKESKALFLLVAAGMVERRGRFRLRLHNHAIAVEGMLTVTGEFGLVEALQSLLAAVWGDWESTLSAWAVSETREASPVLCERLPPDEWRLTEEGVYARAELDGEQPQAVLDFVLKRGFFDGKPRLVSAPTGPRVSQRRPVRGHGRLDSIRKVPADSLPPPSVNIGNWADGANEIAKVLQAMNAPDRSGPAHATDAGYTIYALRMMVGVDNSTLNRYARKVKVRIAPPGKKDFRYSIEEVRTILQAIVEGSTQDEVVSRCRTALEELTKLGK